MNSFLTALAVLFSLPALCGAEDLVFLKKIGIESSNVVLDMSGQAKVQVLPINEPPQLVIDLANTRNRARPRSIEGAGLIRRVRSSQYQPGPDWAARVVVDMSAMAGYQVKWEADRLFIVLHGAVQPAAEEPSEAVPEPAASGFQEPPATEERRTPAPAVMPGMDGPAPVPAVQEPAAPQPPKKGRKGRKTVQAAPKSDPMAKPEPLAEPAAETEDLPNAAPASGPSSDDLLPQPTAAAPAPEKKPETGKARFLKVGPFPHEGAMKIAQDELSSLGYTVVPLKGKN
jgi:hypothetical protein